MPEPFPPDPAWRGRVRVAYLDEPPFFEPTDDPANPTGCDIELLREILDTLGVVDVEYVLTSFAELIPGLTAERWTINVPMFVTPERAAIVGFTRAVWSAPDAFIVRAGDGERFSSYESIAADLAARLAVVRGQVQEATARRAGVPADRIVAFADQASAARAVLAGDADASASTAPGTRAFLDRLQDPRLAFAADRMATARGPVPVGAFSTSRANDDLRRALDAVLATYLGTPRHVALLRRYGFGRESLPPGV
jgi:polar amino acid transport system substrate-binding protein